MSASRIGNRKAVETAPIFCESRREARAHAANDGRKHFPREQIGLRVGRHVRHEVEDHEAGENRRDLRTAIEIGRGGGDREADGASDEADDLKADAAEAVHQQDRRNDAYDQQKIDEARPPGRQLVVVDEIGDVTQRAVLWPTAEARMVGVKMPMP